MKHLRKFDSVSEMNTALASATIDILALAYDNGTPVLKAKQGSSPTPDPSIPFYVENITQETETLTISKNEMQPGELSFPVEISIDGTTWSTFGTTGGTPLTRTLQPGDKVYLRATTDSWKSYWEDYSYCITGVSKVGGNIMSLLYGSNFTGNETTFPSESDHNFYSLFYNMDTRENADLINASELILPAVTLTDSCYESLFFGCTSLTTAPAILPATTLAVSCYSTMFSGCTSLTTAPAILPATTLAGSCYYYMFYDCTTLTTAPTLPATTLANNCYGYMFKNCTSLTTAPALPATTLTNNCYQSMFQNCGALTAAPALPATTLANECYGDMFNGCTSITTAPLTLPATTLAFGCYYGMFSGCRLTTAPVLPATALTESCYQGMFKNCTSLTTAPALPATTLARLCYGAMFSGCTSLTTASALPATTLANQCYGGMFQGCTSLVTAPELPAETLANNCYMTMFNGCTNLNYIKCLATDISATTTTTDWVKGVASTGTFIKAASMSDWTTGNSGIPSGWTVQDATA